MVKKKTKKNKKTVEPIHELANNELANNELDNNELSKDDEEKKDFVNIFDQKPHIVSGEGIEESLETVKKLMALSITIGSPPFLALGPTFVTKFERLKLLQEVSKSQSQITNNPHKSLDKELSDFLENKFAVKKSDPTEGNVRNFLEQIAAEQKINIFDAGLMVKPGNIVFLLASGSIIKKGNDIHAVSVKDLAGKSSIISPDKVSAAFNADSVRLNTKEPFNYILKIDSVSNNIICQLYKDGIASPAISLVEWLNN